MNPIFAKANNLTQNLQGAGRPTVRRDVLLSKSDYNTTASTGQSDSYFPSPKGIGEGPSVVEKLFKKMGDAWKRAGEEPKFINPPYPGALPLGARPQTAQPLFGPGQGVQRPFGTGEFLGKDTPKMEGTSKPSVSGGFDIQRPWGTGELLGKDIPKMEGTVDLTPLGARDNPYLQPRDPYRDIMM